MSVTGVRGLTDIEERGASVERGAYSLVQCHGPSCLAWASAPENPDDWDPPLAEDVDRLAWDIDVAAALALRLKEAHVVPPTIA